MKKFFASTMAAPVLIIFTSNPAFPQGTAQNASPLETIGGIIIGTVFILIIAMLACPDLATAILNLFSRKRHP